MKILGVDPSLSATGLARITIDMLTPPYEAGDLAELVEIQTVTVHSAGSNKDTPRQRRDRVAAIRAQIVRAALDCDVVLIETLFANRMVHQAALMDRAWLWGSVVDELHKFDIPVVHVPVQKVKMLATGKGGGVGTDKTGVAVGMAKMWGNLADPKGDNEFDALALATLAAMKVARTRLPIRVLERHLEVVAGLDWADLTSKGLIPA